MGRRDPRGIEGVREKRITTRFTETERDRAERAAAVCGVGLSVFVRDAIREAVKREDAKAKRIDANELGCVREIVNRAVDDVFSQLLGDRAAPTAGANTEDELERLDEEEMREPDDEDE
jgi:uncharacterized protein (DUF1778 family)